MSAQNEFDSGNLRRALDEIDQVRQVLPAKALRTLALEVVKRLSTALPMHQPIENHPTDAEIDQLCRALISEDKEAGARLIAKASSDGESFENICRLYLTVAARRLGEWWEDDSVNFIQVTGAVGRIYAILRSLPHTAAPVSANDQKFAVFAPVPGEDHTLGIAMAADMFREKGWDIKLLVGRSHDDLVNDLSQSSTRLIGLSASGKTALPALIRLIVALRISNPQARILVCGRIAALDLNLVGVSGADSAAVDFPEALSEMERMAGLTAAR